MTGSNSLFESLEAKPLTVSELVEGIKTALEDTFFDVEVEGEISGFTAHRSGHYYFTLKDEKAQIRVVMFRNRNIYLSFKPENGMKVIARGKVTVYEKEGKMELLVEIMEQVGLGEMLLALRRLAERLQKEGLFDAEKKKPLPAFPKTIGIVTSPDGAAVRDILNVINRRFAELHIQIFPARVQGEGAAEELIKGIEYFDDAGNVDVIILTRGGGSFEDLMPFNDESLVRAIYRCRIPIISAVGHEIDWTIADYAADYRAPTPSAAAEVIIEKKSVILKTITGLIERLSNQVLGKIRLEKERLNGLRRSRLFADPMYLVNRESQRLDSLDGRLSLLARGFLTSAKERINRSVSLLETLNPLNVLQRGYSITMLPETRTVVRSNAELKTGDEILTRLAKGSVTSRITGTEDKKPDR